MTTLDQFIEALRAGWLAFDASLRGATKVRRGTIVPAYISPTRDPASWAAIIAAAKRIPLVAIVNPNSGPGTARSPGYADVIAKLTAAGGRAIGYVSTDHGNRDVRAVEADVGLWRSLYPEIGGIFFDEMEKDPDKVDLYAGYVKLVRSLIPGAFVAVNPGVAADVGYYDRARPDMMIMSERASTVPTLPTWAKDAPDSYFAILSHGVTDVEAMRRTIRAMPQSGHAWAYVTDRLHNQGVWSSLPSYWQTEVDEIAALNAA